MRIILNTFHTPIKSSGQNKHNFAPKFIFSSQYFHASWKQLCTTMDYQMIKRKSHLQLYR